MTTASPEIYFWLIPLDENAREVLRLLGGLERYSALKSADRRGRRGLKVAVDVNADDPTTLLRLGINFDSDVKVACSFRVNHESGIVMLHDESKAQTTKILVMPNQKQAYYHFVRDRVVVNSDINPYILLGPAQFGLSWNPERELPMTLLRSRSVGLALPTYSKPKLSNDGLGRLHLVGLISKLSTGNLYRAVDVDSGLTLVTKKTWEKSNGQSSWEYDYLSRFEHVRLGHIPWNQPSG